MTELIIWASVLLLLTLAVAVRQKTEDLLERRHHNRPAPRMKRW